MRYPVIKKYTITIRVEEPGFILYLYVMIPIAAFLVVMSGLYWKIQLLSAVAFGVFGFHSLLAIFYTIRALSTLKVEKKDVSLEE